MVHKQLQRHSTYGLYKCFSYFYNADYNEEFIDSLGMDNFTTLPPGRFWWLISIHPGHLVLHFGNTCYIEPYYSSHFSR